MLINNLLIDLKVRKAELAEQASPVYVEILDSSLIVDKQQLCYDCLDLDCYQVVVDLLGRLYNHYPNILGDAVYQAINIRTNKHAATDVLNTRQVMIRKWISTYDGVALELVQITGHKFKMLIFSTADQFLTALCVAKQSWEFFSSKQHCNNISLFPYMLDMFLTGTIEDSVIRTPMSELFNKSLPDWHPLLG